MSSIVSDVTTSQLEISVAEQLAVLFVLSILVKLLYLALITADPAVIEW